MPSYMASGIQAVAENILRGWTTTPGQLIDDPAWGYNLTDMIGQDMSRADLAYAAQKAAAQADTDERVLTSAVTVTLDVAGGLHVTGSFTTALGPFQLVLSIGAVTQASITVGQ